jgi:hypothetical protein
VSVRAAKVAANARNVMSKLLAGSIRVNAKS